jgi:hypothetical protein
MDIHPELAFPAHPGAPFPSLPFTYNGGHLCS